MRIAVLQVNSKNDKEANVREALRLLELAAERGADVAVLPENVNYLGPKEGLLRAAEEIPGPTSERFAAKARELGVWILAGSIPEVSEYADHNYNTSLLIDRQGAIVARYRKIHLFDVEISGNVSAQESATVAPGEEVVTAAVEGHTVGLSICYDLRFPELYRELALRGAEIVFVPAAFTLYTGKDHWTTLLRARAIENQCFVVAAGQIGTHEPNMSCYGRSTIIDPWGTVLAQAPDGVGIADADLDLDRVAEIRRQLPSLSNRRPDVYARNSAQERESDKGVVIGAAREASGGQASR
jgi:deaminated glutathione amidase